ncbi:MAG: radical SAM protein [Oscillospiraceae bacterium]|nr:radical SAM protein [Oscillospiraceae bacterium]
MSTDMRQHKHANLSIFVPHIGCPHKCTFCNQNTITGQTFIPHAGDVKEICEKAIADGVDMGNTEIAFFGGSFTAIPLNYMIELLEAARRYVSRGFRGIRVSTRPDAINRPVLEILYRHGVTTIELGAQSMFDDVLTLNERGHTAQDVVNASKLIKEYSFDLGLQMMLGLYGSTPEKDYETALRIADLQPKEVRIYPTVVLKDTKLGELYTEGKYETYDLSEAVELSAKLLDLFESRGINVIKLGLHSSTDVENSMLGGIYHPAFRELCEGVRARNTMEKLMGKGTSYTFTVRPDYLSKALGHKKSNIEYFREKGTEVTIKADPAQTENILIKEW